MQLALGDYTRESHSGCSFSGPRMMKYILMLTPSVGAVILTDSSVARRRPFLLNAMPENLQYWHRTAHGVVHESAGLYHQYVPCFPCKCRVWRIHWCYVPTIDVPWLLRLRELFPRCLRYITGEEAKCPESAGYVSMLYLCFYQ